MTLIDVIECEITHDKMRERQTCAINPKFVRYISPCDDFDGYSYIGLGEQTTIVKGTPEELKKKLEGKKWLKIIHRQ